MTRFYPSEAPKVLLSWAPRGLGPNSAHRSGSVRAWGLDSSSGTCLSAFLLLGAAVNHVVLGQV